MRKLIINADDFGIHTYVNQAIIDGYRAGAVTSASLMPGGACFEQAVALREDNPALDLGIHLTLVGGSPVCDPAQIPTLVDINGSFLSSHSEFLLRFIKGNIALAEVRTECTAQVEKTLACCSPISHLDSHQHLHVVPGIIDIVLELAKAYGIPAVRIPAEPYGFFGQYPGAWGRFLGRGGLTFLARLAKTKARRAGLHSPDHFFGMLAGGNMREPYLLNILKQLPAGVSEIMLHPGRDNAVLQQEFRWNYHWQEELAAVAGQNVLQYIQEQNIKLISFGELADG